MLLIYSAENMTHELRRLAFGYGFDHCGCAPALAVTNPERFIRWINDGYYAYMNWMARSLDKRLQPALVVSDVKSVVVCAINYFHDTDFSLNRETAKISRYAWGKDYHQVVQTKLQAILKDLKRRFPDVNGICYTDTGPVIEKYWAVQAGVGWQGKHTLVISPAIGSWMFLGVILLTHELKYDAPLSDRCGDCNLCLQACPTGAIVQPYVLDARRCLSWATIECKDPRFPAMLTDHSDRWIYGCDRCQEVCPWNHQLQKNSPEEAFKPRTSEITADDFQHMTEKDFQERFKDTVLVRIGYERFIRNGKAIFSIGS